MPTIKDIALDTNTLDLLIEDGDVSWIYDADVVAQMLRIRLRRVAGEWYLDTTSGVDYLGIIFNKKVPRETVEATLRSEITTTPYVLELASFEATFDAAARRLEVEFEAKTTFGDISVLVELP